MQEEFVENTIFSFLVLNLIDGLTNMFVAGSDTISSSLSFGLLYISSSPKVMQKIHKEIDSVIGRNRLPDPSDRLR